MQYLIGLRYYQEQRYIDAIFKLQGNETKLLAFYSTARQNKNPVSALGAQLEAYQLRVRYGAGQYTVLLVNVDDADGITQEDIEQWALKVSKKDYEKYIIRWF